MLGYGRINLVVLSLKTNKRLLDVPFQACHNRSVLQQPHPLQDTNQHGAVAHLVERCIRIAEVRGSSPLSSTKLNIQLKISDMRSEMPPVAYVAASDFWCCDTDTKV